MADLRWLELNYPKGPREAFEDLATLLFCTSLKVSTGVNRRHNQKGIESDPVTKGGKVYAFQAKYYDATTKLAATKHKRELIKSVEAARKEGVTNLMLFINKNLPDKVDKGDGVRGKTQFEQDIDAAANGRGDEHKVELEWWSISKIESTLDMEGYLNIRKAFLGEGDDERKLSAYYDYVCSQFDGDHGSELYGAIPLRDSYIEPMVKGEDENDLSVREYIERWLDKRDSHIAVISGEPGHGKTSLCRKAVRDFHKDGWLAGKVLNVFCFSLNPARTNALSGNEIDFYSLLSWGNNRRSLKHRIDEEDCKNALILLDGFDELFEWHPKFDLWGFIKKYVIDFQEDNDAHVILTTRNMVVEPVLRSYSIGDHKLVPIVRLQPVSRERQIVWIERYAEYCRSPSLVETDTSLLDPEVNSEEMLGELDTYLGKYRCLPEDADLQDILGIPIIFRMIVAARYLPSVGESITQVYDDLFEVTWERHKHQDFELSKDPKTEIKERLSQHALRVYLDNNDTAAVDDIFDSSWLFSFYTTHEGEKRVGFLHRSFYQYFLAHEILSWFKSYADEADENVFRSRLAYLARGKLDITTLLYIRDVYERNRKSLDEAFSKACGILKETDGFLGLPENEREAERIRKLIQLDRSNNVFWNTVSILSVCGLKIDSNRVNVRALQLYNLSGCVLTNSRLQRADLRGIDLHAANLSGAVLRMTDLSMADLRGADLHGADLRRANLSKADFYWAVLNNADLTGADLSGADFRVADLYWADLSHSNLSGSDFSGASLSLADLHGANLHKADFSGTDLSDTDFQDADLSEADLSGALLHGADLRGANLKGTDLRGANLSGAITSGVDLSESYLDAGVQFSH